MPDARDRAIQPWFFDHSQIVQLVRHSPVTLVYSSHLEILPQRDRVVVLSVVNAFVPAVVARGRPRTAESTGGCLRRRAETPRYMARTT
jgi:hypothetical protein